MRFTFQPGAQPLAGYTIHRGIHRGGFGEVYYAQSDGGKEVALKLLQREQDVELRGVRQCLNLKHSNLVNLFDVRTDGQGEQWVVMEYVNGSSLEDVLASFPNGLPLDEIREWLSGIVAGVAYLHDRGIVHRDLKPANVYRENGIVKVGDVGLSKRLGSDRRRAHTQSVGTVYYMAPEVANGQYGPEVDVYSLGIMLYEMLTGQLPFTGESTAEVLMKHLTANADLNAIPPSLRPVIARALAKDPQKRISSVVQLEQEFQDALAFASRDGSLKSMPTAMVGGNGTTTYDRATLKETPPTETGEKFDTVPAIPGITISTAPLKSAAQAASAYAQYPPEAQPVPPPIPVNFTPKPPPLPRTDPPASEVAVPPTLNWPLLITGIAGLALFAPGTWRSWSGLGAIGVAVTIAAFLRARQMQRPDIATTTSPLPKRGTSASPGSLVKALNIGSICASLVSVGIYLAAEFFQKSPAPPAPEFLAYFTTISIAATWLILLVGHIQHRVSWLDKNRRKVYFVAGTAVGSLAFGLDHYLRVDYRSPPQIAMQSQSQDNPAEQMIIFDGGVSWRSRTSNRLIKRSEFQPAFKSIGVHSLVDLNMKPTWLGYLIFFGGLMFWHRWWQDMSPRRSRPLSLGRLTTTGIAAWLLTIVFAFPQATAVLWALTISAAVQLASPWTPPGPQSSRSKLC